MKKRVNILFQSDDNFAFMVGVALSSLLENAAKDGDAAYVAAHHSVLMQSVAEKAETAARILAGR